MSAVSELVEQLRGQAVELREGAKGRRAGNVLGLRLQNDIAEQHASLADLIDGMLQEHELTFDHTDHNLYCRRCKHPQPWTLPVAATPGPRTSPLLSGK